MDRRRFVCLLGLLAGCNVSTSVAETNNAQPATPTKSPSPRPAATPSRAPGQTTQPTASPTTTDTATEEPPSPTPEQTETPTGREVRGSQQLAGAEQALAEVISTFTEGYGSELTDVTASSTEILNADFKLQVALAKAQEEYVEAENAAVNEEQQTAANRMRRCWHFLRHTVRTQTAVVQAYEDLTRARKAFEEVESGLAGAAVADFGTAHRWAEIRYQDVAGSSTAEDTSVIEILSALEYQNKLAQFEADIGVYDDLKDTLRDFVDGVDWLESAKAEFNGENRTVSRAIDQAEEAERLLRSVRRQLRTLINNAGEDTTIVPALDELQSVAVDLTEEAEYIQDRY